MHGSWLLVAVHSFGSSSPVAVGADAVALGVGAPVATVGGGAVCVVSDAVGRGGCGGGLAWHSGGWQPPWGARQAGRAATETTNDAARARFGFMRRMVARIAAGRPRAALRRRAVLATMAGCALTDLPFPGFCRSS